MSANLQRRHLNESQRAWVADKVASLPHGSNQYRGPANLPVLTQPEAARMLGVSERLVRSARSVREDAIPEFHDRVERGNLAVSLAERVSKLPTEEQQRLVNADEGELRGATKKFRRAEREAELADSTKRASEALGYKVYGVLYVDPPWRFEPYSRDTGMDRAADNHYPTEKIEAIKAMKVPAADNAVLFMWATAPLLPEALDVMKSWGFIYRSNLIWAKPHAGTGYWFRSQHEQLLVGTRGSVPCPAPGEQYCSLIEAPLGKHSVKPASVAEMIEEMFPNVTGRRDVRSRATSWMGRLGGRGPMILFPANFREHVTPRLRNLARAEAYCIARDVEDFSGAAAAIWHYANKFGANCLPHKLIDTLDDWICTTLLAEVNRAIAELPAAERDGGVS